MTPAVENLFYGPLDAFKPPISAVGRLQVALVEDGGDVGVVQAVLVLGAQGGGAQGRAVSLLGLPPETERRTRSDSSL